MAGVSLSDDQVWMVARRIFRRLLEAARTRVEQGSELDYWLQVGIANDMLAIELVDATVARGLVSLLKETAKAEIEKCGDDQPIEMNLYCKALADFLKMLQTEEGS